MAGAPDREAEPAEHRGADLGLPASGPGSVAGFGTRLVALLVDWALANLAALALARSTSVWTPGATVSWLPLTVFLLEVWLLTGLTGASAGQRLLRIAVLPLDRRPVGLWRSLVRTLLIALVLPPLVSDQDGRGLHDLAVGTVVVRAPR